MILDSILLETRYSIPNLIYGFVSFWIARYLIIIYKID